MLTHPLFTVLDFFNQMSLIYTSIADVAVAKNLPMKAGDVEYQWEGKLLPAPEYVTKATEWMQSLLDNLQIFPATMGMLNVPADALLLIENHR